MQKKSFHPNFHTPLEKHYQQEQAKRKWQGFIGSVREEFINQDKPDLIFEAEQLAKASGIYLEFDRSKTGKEKEWMYMVRISNPGGGPISKEQWLALDGLSEKYTTGNDGRTSLRLTTRQNIQFHWVNKTGVLDIVKTCAENDLRSLNGCGDNTRNVMACPLSRFSDICDVHRLAQKAGEYFQLPIEPFIKIFAIDPGRVRKPGESFQYGPQLLNRKFKIGFSTVHRDPSTGQLHPDNCVEVRTHDVGVVPVIEDNAIKRFQIYVGGGQGERNGKPSLAALGQPLCQVTKDQILPVLDAIVSVHQEFGDRQNRHWARLKYVIKAKGIAWFLGRVSSRIGFPLEQSDDELDYGPVHYHYGWTSQPFSRLWSFGIFIENGRITDAGPNGKLKAMIRDMISKYPAQLMVTPNQDLLFQNIPDGQKEKFEADLKTYGYGRRYGKPYSTLRKLSGACVGRDTCRLTYTDSEKFEPFLIDELEAKGWSDLSTTIGTTGCERQCFRPSTKAVGLVGSGLNRYQLRLGGTEDGCPQGGCYRKRQGCNVPALHTPR